MSYFKNKKTDFSKSLFGFSLLSAILFGSTFQNKLTPLKAGSNQPKTVFDYSTTQNGKYILGDELLTQLTQGSATDLEKNYIKNQYGLLVDDYSSEIPYHIGNVEGKYYIAFDEKEGFTPTKFVANGKTYFANDIQSTGFQKYLEIETETLENAKVYYNKTTKLNKYQANEILNYAYLIGKNEQNVVNKVNAYNEAKAKYDQYLLDVADYNAKNKAYLDEKAIFEVENEAYADYVLKKEQYDADMLKYNEYLEQKNLYNEQVAKYTKYLDDLASYNANLELIAKAEEKYEQEIVKARHQLDVMSIIYKTFKYKDIQGSIKAWIEGNAVTTVLERQGELKNIGVPEKAIKLAGDATVALRKVFADYDALYKSNAENKEQKCYEYYISNYAKTIKPNFVALTQCLEKFFQNSNVRSIMEQQGKTQKYILLVAELIYISNALQDSDVQCYDDVYGDKKNSYILNLEHKLDGESVRSILGMDEELIDTSLSGAALKSYPVEPAAIYGEKPTEVTKPVAPAEVKKPIEPVEVFPADASEASKVQALKDARDLAYEKVKTPVQNPGNAPSVSPSADSDVVALYNMVENETLSFRQEFNEDQIITEEYVYDVNTTNLQKVAVIIIQGTNGPHLNEIIFYNEGEDPEPQYPILPLDLGNGQYDVPTEYLQWNQEDLVQKIKEAVSSGKTFELATVATTIDIYKVKWVYEDGSEIENTSSEAFDGFSPLFKYSDGSTLPIKVSSDPSKIYKFKSFAYKDESGVETDGLAKSEVIAAAQNDGENIEIIVKFEEKILNKIFFNYGEGYTQYVDTGIRVNYNGPKPLKQSTPNADYEFLGWKIKGTSDSDIVEMPYKVETVGDIEFVPVFKTISKYTISFNVNGKITSAVYEDGESVVVPSYVEKETTLNAYYEFKGWKLNNSGSVLTEIPNASGNAMYYACYEEHAIVSGADLSLVDGTLIIKVLGSNEVDLSKLFELMESGYPINPISIKFSNVVVDLTEAQVRQAISKDVDIIGVNLLSTPEMKFKLNVKSGLENVNGIVAKVNLLNVENANNLKAYASDSQIDLSVINNKQISFSVSSNTEVTFLVFYKLNLDQFAPVTFKVNGELVDSNTSLEFNYGETVTIEGIPNSGINLMSMVAINNDNEVIKSIFGSTITLEIKEDTNIIVDTKKEVYTVTYMVDDEVYLVIEAAYGSKIESPVAFKASEGETSFQFSGWDKEVTTVTENVVLHAQFNEISPEKSGDSLSKGRIVYTKLIALCIIGVCALAFLIGLLLVLRKKKDKEKGEKYE